MLRNIVSNIPLALGLCAASTQRIKLSHYFETINPEYSYLKMTPNHSIKNNQTDKIALSIASLASSMSFRSEKGFIWHLPFGRNRLFPTKISRTNPAKVSYYIYLTKTNAEFYFVIPTAALSIIKEKIRSVWTTVTMCEITKDMLPTFTSSATAYSMSWGLCSNGTENRNKKSFIYQILFWDVIP